MRSLILLVFSLSSLGQSPCDKTDKACVKPHYVVIAWDASRTNPDYIAGYDVYRGTTSGGPYTKINGSLVKGLKYRDTTVQAGKTYYYVTTTIDIYGGESPYSNEVSAKVPSP